ncbi:MAG: fumarate hydratase [Desulfurococcales archaeon]|nr:fumarate hydratase [Desulfurococcales archaeon]
MVSYVEKARRGYLDTGTGFPHEIIWGMGLVKAAAAEANYRLGLLPLDKYRAIKAEALRLADGEYDGDIDVDVFQTGSGTGLNLNVNEVIARKAWENHGVKVHPLDDVNMSQSSNDVVPTAIRLAAVKTGAKTRESLGRLIDTLSRYVEEYSGLVKPGRTHLRDALPVTLGQELSAYLDAFKHDHRLLGHALEYVGEVPLGGTAVGTGVNSPEGYRDLAVDELAKLSGLQVSPANTFRAMRLLTDIVFLSSVYRVIALELWRLSQDLRLMFSGPFTGISEIDIRQDIPGSSIMPGKRNPVTLEAIMQASTQAAGIDATISNASMLGEFELSMGIPVTGYNIVVQAKLLSEALDKMSDLVLPSIEPRPERMRSLAYRSAALLTVLSPVLGYDRVAAIVKRLQEGASLEEALEEAGLEPERVRGLLDVEKLVKPYRIEK